MKESGFEGIVGSQHINVHYRLEGIGAKLIYRGEEIACRASAVLCQLVILLKSPRPTYITKSKPPSSFTHLSTDACRLSMFLTSTDPKPSTFAPFLAVVMSLAIRSVFSTFRPTMQAFAPRWTRARTWALHIVPAPPVQ